MTQLRPPYPEILDRLRDGRIIPFLGSGSSLGERNPKRMPWQKREGKYLPTAHELAAYLAQKAEFPKREHADLSKVAQYYVLTIGRDALDEKLHGIFDFDGALSPLHTFLADLPAPLLIVTTNYDCLVERAFSKRPHDLVIHTTDTALGDQLLWWPHDQSKPRTVNANTLDIDLEKVTVIYKMHGGIDRESPERDQYVITEDDYIEFLTRMSRRKAVPAIFAEPFQERPFLFLGYGLNDWNLRVVLNRIGKDMSRPKKIKSWAIQYKPSPLEKRFWQERGVEVYDMTVEKFVQELKSR